ncbi:MAG: hypothetical protein DWQ05_11070 [Calditrichaeota bacterium]|nr:MAG: hypothetical protein DWQ05_11070 [Calditrichota bacterium]
MVDTIVMKDLTNHAESIYEAIIMISRRARQINNEQKQQFEKDFYDESSDDFLDDDYEPEEIVIETTHLPKPHTIALQEFLDGEIVKIELTEDAE